MPGSDSLAPWAGRIWALVSGGSNPLRRAPSERIRTASEIPIEVDLTDGDAFPIYMKISDKVQHLRRVGMSLRRDCRTPPDQPLDGEEGSSLGQNPSCAAPSAIPQLRH